VHLEQSLRDSACESLSTKHRGPHELRKNKARIKSYTRHRRDTYHDEEGKRRFAAVTKTLLQIDLSLLRNSMPKSRNPGQEWVPETQNMPRPSSFYYKSLCFGKELTKRSAAFHDPLVGSSNQIKAPWCFIESPRRRTQLAGCLRQHENGMTGAQNTFFFACWPSRLP